MLINRMVHILYEDIDNRLKRGFHNPLISAVQRAFPEAKCIWADDNRIHINFFTEEIDSNCCIINLPKHIAYWFNSFKLHPKRAEPISFNISIEGSILLNASA